jgi:hypothetical protein
MACVPINRELFDVPVAASMSLLPVQHLFVEPLKPHSYKMSEAEVDEVFSRPIYKKIIGSKAFQRLKNINFLGAIDYVVNPRPSRRHTRYQHSLGVARLALQYSALKNLPAREEVVCVISALLHDIGHAPLSHSLESVFIEEYGIGHHIVAEKILKGELPFARNLHAALIEFGINPFEILTIINGTASEPYSEIFNHEINIDTIEGILRSCTYIYKTPKFWPPHEVLNALVSRADDAVGVLDGFWQLKGEAYQKLINSKNGVLADYICKDYMRTNKESFFEDYHYSTERELEKKHPILFSKLRSLGSVELCELLPDTNQIVFNNRNFHINHKVSLDSVWAIDKRYTQSKSKEIFQLQPKRGK